MRRLLYAVTLALALTVGSTGTASAAVPSTRYLGVFQEGAPTSIADSVQNAYGVTPASVMGFDSWGRGRPLPADDAEMLWRRGIVPHYPWEPWNTALGPNDAGQIHLADIIDGGWDAYIKARAKEFASVRLPILVRWGHEFNG